MNDENMKKLGLIPWNLHRETTIKWLEANHYDDWIMYRIPRRSGRTTMMLVNALDLCVSHKGEDICIRVCNRQQAEEAVEQMVDMANKLGLCISYRGKRIHINGSRILTEVSDDGMTPKTSMIRCRLTLIDQYFDDQEKIKRIDKIRLENPSLTADQILGLISMNQVHDS